MAPFYSFMTNFEPNLDIFCGMLWVKEWRFGLYISLVALGAGLV